MPQTVQIENQPNEVIVLNDDRPTKADFEKLTRQFVSQGARIVALENANANRNNTIRPTPSTWETMKSKISSLMAVFNACKLGAWVCPLITTGFAAFMIWTLPVQATVIGVIVVVVGATIYYIYPPKEKLT
jgi:hypothetical protein